MTSRLEDTIRATLEADTTLVALLTGGIFDASEMDRDGWTLNNVSRTTAGRIKPFAVLRWSGPRPGGGLLTSGRQTVTIWLYEDTGFTSVRLARERLFTLLDKKYFTTTEKSAVRGLWIGGIDEDTADELGGASLTGARYQFTYARR